MDANELDQESEMPRIDTRKPLPIRPTQNNFNTFPVQTNYPTISLGKYLNFPLPPKFEPLHVQKIEKPHPKNPVVLRKFTSTQRNAKNFRKLKPTRCSNKECSQYWNLSEAEKNTFLAAPDTNGIGCIKCKSHARFFAGEKDGEELWRCRSWFNDNKEDEQKTSARQEKSLKPIVSKENEFHFSSFQLQPNVVNQKAEIKSVVEETQGMENKQDCFNVPDYDESFDELVKQELELLKKLQEVREKKRKIEDQIYIK
eukprot:gene9085-1180_t